MKRKKILWVVIFLILIYPSFTLFEATNAIGSEEYKAAENDVIQYQISSWLSWVVLVSTSVYYKWTRRKNSFFFFTYAYLLLVFGLFGYLSQELVYAYDLPTSFEDDYTFGILIALQNILAAGILTAFLQGAVWWFTRRWHRT